MIYSHCSIPLGIALYHSPQLNSQGSPWFVNHTLALALSPLYWYHSIAHAQLLTAIQVPKVWSPWIHCQTKTVSRDLLVCQCWWRVARSTCFRANWEHLVVINEERIIVRRMYIWRTEMMVIVPLTKSVKVVQRYRNLSLEKVFVRCNKLCCSIIRNTWDDASLSKYDGCSKQ